MEKASKKEAMKVNGGLVDYSSPYPPHVQDPVVGDLEDELMKQNRNLKEKSQELQEKNEEMQNENIQDDFAEGTGSEGGEILHDIAEDFGIF
ncbi:MAG: hypothetical protein ACQERJ_02100 [Bacillota bacterium]